MEKVPFNGICTSDIMDTLEHENLKLQMKWKRLIFGRWDAKDDAKSGDMLRRAPTVEQLHLSIKWFV